MVRRMKRGELNQKWRAALFAALVGFPVPAFAQSSFADRTSMTWDGVLTGLFLGFMAFSTIYNLAFFSLLRERFLLWQTARATAYFTLGIALSPLAMGPWLQPESFARGVFIDLMFDLAIFVSGPFLRAYLEPGMVSERNYRWLGRLCWLVPLTTPAMIIPDCPPVYMMARNALMVSLLLLCCHTVVVAWLRGSHTARYQAAAWSGLTLVFGISLFHDIVLGRPYTMFLFALFPALALETVMTAWGILARLNRLRQDREDARAMADAMEHMAHTDPLTGLPNRRAIEQQFALQRPCALAIIDLDLFKQVNDRHGHDVGDKVLFATGSALDSGTAVAARIGGEEFLLLLYGDSANAVREAEMLRQRVTSRVTRLVGGLDGPVTASLGLALINEGDDFSTAMKRADLNLYVAKDRGRNCAIFSNEALAA